MGMSEAQGREAGAAGKDLAVSAQAVQAERGEHRSDLRSVWRAREAAVFPVCQRKHIQSYFIYEIGNSRDSSFLI